MNCDVRLQSISELPLAAQRRKAAFDSLLATISPKPAAAEDFEVTVYT